MEELKESSKGERGLASRSGSNGLREFGLLLVSLDRADLELVEEWVVDYW